MHCLLLLENNIARSFTDNHCALALSLGIHSPLPNVSLAGVGSGKEDAAATHHGRERTFEE